MGINYHFKVLVPSLGRRVSFKEITIRDLININKSIINDDHDEVIECFNGIIDHCCIEKGLMFTLLDKAIILLSIRAYSISPFCKLTARDAEMDKDFEFTLEMSTLLNALQGQPVIHKATHDVGELTIEFGIPLNPVKNVNDVQPIDYIHRIRKGEEVLVDFNTPKPELTEIVDSLEFEFFNLVKKYAIETYKAFNENPLYVVDSPFTQRVIIKQKMSLDYGFYETIKMFFTENLNNLYRSIYNFSETLHMTPTYTENLVPVEKDLFWSYYVRDAKDREANKQSNTKGTPFTP